MAPRLCTKCNERHAAPTGKRCNRVVQEAARDPVPDPDPEPTLREVMHEFATRMDAMQVRTTEQIQEALVQQPTRSRSRSSSRGPRRRRSYSRSRSRSRSSSRKLKSGVHIESDPRTKVLVIWPHAGIFKGASQVRVPFDDLSAADLTLGFVKRISEQTDKESRRGSDNQTSRAMLEFFHSWSEDVREYPWETVRGYIKLVYYAMEQGTLTWADTARIEKIRARATAVGAMLSSASSAQSTQSAAESKPGRTQWCADYQKGKCTSTQQTHSSSRGQVSHICAFCYQKQGKEFPHSKDECNNKVKSSSKNI
jgi:hypothetical protein